MSFFELILVASIESNPGIKQHQLEPSKVHPTPTLSQQTQLPGFIANWSASIATVLAHAASPYKARTESATLSTNTPDKTVAAAVPRPSQWRILSTVVELATEKNELLTDMDVQFQPDQFAQESENWLQSAGIHLIGSATTQVDPNQETALSSPTHSSSAQQAAPTSPTDQAATTSQSATNPALSAAASKQGKSFIERLKRHTTDPQILVKASHSSSASPETEESESTNHIGCVPHSIAPTNSQLFQVWVGKQVVLNLLDAQQAEAVAQKLRNVLVQDTTLDPARFQLRLFQDQPAIYIKDGLDGEPLLVVTDELASAFNNDNTLLAIDWMNHLRMAFNGTPMDIAQVQAQMYNLQETPQQIEGQASWYGPWFHGRLTATGEIFDKGELTAAHPSLPFDTYLKVTNLENNKSLIVRINDRGPYIEGRNLDLSHRAAQCLGSEKSGVIPFKAVLMDAPVDMAAAE